VTNKLQRIGVMSFARLQAVLFGLIGLLFGFAYSVGGLLIDVLVSLGLLSTESMSTPGLSVGTILAFGAVIGMPAIAAAAGFFLGLVEAVIYNRFGRWFGGISFQFN
jgi:hypothetical protein